MWLIIITIIRVRLLLASNSIKLRSGNQKSALNNPFRLEHKERYACSVSDAKSAQTAVCPCNSVFPLIAFTNSGVPRTITRFM